MAKVSSKVVRELVQTAILILGVFAFRSSVAEPFYVPTGSMIPTIMPGDRLVVIKGSYDIHVPFTDIPLYHRADPARGDVVVFKFPKDPNTDFVKRLIGLPGDEIVVNDGFLTVNGKPVPVSTVSQEQGKTLMDEILGGKHHLIQRLPHAPETRELRFTVPADHYFFMGDNRDNSNDGRYWGFTPKENLKGKAVAIWMSLDSSAGTIPGIRWNRIGNTL